MTQHREKQTEHNAAGDLSGAGVLNFTRRSRSWAKIGGSDRGLTGENSRGINALNDSVALVQVSPPSLPCFLSDFLPRELVKRKCHDMIFQFTLTSWAHMQKPCFPFLYKEKSFYVTSHRLSHLTHLPPNECEVILCCKSSFNYISLPQCPLKFKCCQC